MTSDASKKIVNRHRTTSVAQEFFVRTIAVWLLLLVPGTICALVFGRWLISLGIIPALVALLAVAVYDLWLFISSPANRMLKLAIFFLFGIAIAILLSPIGARFYTVPSTIFDRQTGAVDRAIDSKNTVEPLRNQTLQQTTEVQPLEGTAALEQAKDLGRQAAEMVQNPPHPLPVWKSAQQKWDQAVQQLESISSDSAVYEEASAKLAAYQANRKAIAQRVELEQTAASSYETGIDLVDELVEMAEPIAYAQPKDLAALRTISEKLETATKTFETIPSGTAVSASAQEQLKIVTRNRQSLQSIIEQLESCDSTPGFDCDINKLVEVTRLDQESN